MSTRSKGRACDGKTRHDNRERAARQIGSLARNRGANPTRYVPYLCRHCAGWHVGHRPKRSAS